MCSRLPRISFINIVYTPLAVAVLLLLSSSASRNTAHFIVACVRHVHLSSQLHCGLMIAVFIHFSAIRLSRRIPAAKERERERERTSSFYARESNTAKPFGLLTMRLFTRHTPRCFNFESAIPFHIYRDSPRSMRRFLTNATFYPDKILFPVLRVFCSLVPREREREGGGRNPVRAQSIYICIGSESTLHTKAIPIFRFCHRWLQHKTKKKKQKKHSRRS